MIENKILQSVKKGRNVWKCCPEKRQAIIIYYVLLKVRVYLTPQLRFFFLWKGMMQQDDKSQVIACQYRKYSKHSLKLTLVRLIRPKQKFLGLRLASIHL